MAVSGHFQVTVAIKLLVAYPLEGRLVLGDKLFSIYFYSASVSGSMWFIPYFLLLVFLLVLWGLVIGRQKFLILVG